MLSSKARLAVIALIVANIIWGAAPPVFKWALQDIQPFTLAFSRFFIAAILIAPFAYKYLKVKKEDIGEVFLIGFSGVVVNISAFFLGLKFAPSINASIIASAAPIFLILSSFLILHEKPKVKLILGSLTGLAGVTIIMLEPLFSSQPNLSILGNFLLFVSMLGALGHTIIGRTLMKKYHPLGVTLWMFIVGSLCFFPMAINENISTPLTLSVQGIIGIAYGAVFCSAIAYTLLLWALKYLPAAETGVFAYIDPVVTIIIAYPLLGEKPDLFYFVGAIFVFLGIYIAERRIHWHPLHLLKNRQT